MIQSPESFSFDPVEDPLEAKCEVLSGCFRDVVKNDIVTSKPSYGEIKLAGPKQLAVTGNDLVKAANEIPQQKMRSASLHKVDRISSGHPKSKAPSSYCESQAESIDPVLPQSTVMTRPPAIIIPAINPNLVQTPMSSPGRSHKSPSRRSQTPPPSARSSKRAASPSPTGPVRTPRREIDRMHLESRAPPRFICPLSGRIMLDPVILPTGTTCDRIALEKYLAKEYLSDPVTKQKLKKPIKLVPNNELRTSITAWATEKSPWLLDEDGVLLVKEEPIKELQGVDKQYFNIPGDKKHRKSHKKDGHTRLASERDSWAFVDAKKSSSPSRINISARSGSWAPSRNMDGASSTAPWRFHQGISPLPKSSFRPSGHKSRRSSRSPTKRMKQRQEASKHNRASLIFICTVIAAYIGLYLAQIAVNSWKIAPLSENPWFGAPGGILVRLGAQTALLMEKDNQWWRLFSSPFTPAGLIHTILSSMGLWLYGCYAKKALPRPGFSIPGIYLLSSITGATFAGNLDGFNDISCGAMSGVAGLLGVLFIDQPLQWPKKKLLNLKEWWLVALVLAVNLGIIIVGSLLPFVSVWASSMGFMVGLLMSFVILTVRKVKNKEQKNVKLWISGQVCAILILVSLATVSTVGLAIGTTLGEGNKWLQNASCIEFDSEWWHCTPYGYHPLASCGLGEIEDHTANAIYCPDMDPISIVPVPISYMNDEQKIKDLCVEYCGEGIFNSQNTTAFSIDGGSADEGAGLGGSQSSVQFPSDSKSSVPTTIIDTSASVKEDGNANGEEKAALLQWNSDSKSTDDSTSRAGRKLRAGRHLIKAAFR